MSESGAQPAGCRDVGTTVIALIVFALPAMAIGLYTINQSGCSGACETLGLTLLYAGLPISALLGVFFGDVVVAWPLDITLWVVTGFAIARIAERSRRRPLILAIGAIIIALAYGLVLSSFVEIAIT